MAEPMITDSDRQVALVLARLAFPGIETASGFHPPYDYTPLIKAIGTPIVRIDEEDYQGDTFVLLKSEKAYGMLIFGWGSCSGCDALQAVGSYQALGDLMLDLMRSTKWFESFEDAKAYIAGDKDRVPAYHEQKQIWKTFQQKVAAAKEVDVCV